MENVEAGRALRAITAEVDNPYSFSRYDATIYKLILRVEADGGCYMVYMTLPSSLPGTIQELKGTSHTFTATLSRGKDAHFAFGKRPVAWTEEAVAAAAEKAQKKADRAAKKAARISKEAVNA